MAKCNSSNYIGKKLEHGPPSAKDESTTFLE